MDDYLIGWHLPKGSPVTGQTTRVSLTRPQVRAVTDILDQLTGSGEVLDFFIEPVPEKSATFDQFVEIATDPVKTPLWFAAPRLR